MHCGLTGTLHRATIKHILFLLGFNGKYLESSI